jgi:PAP2 superfamily
MPLAACRWEPFGVSEIHANTLLWPRGSGSFSREIAARLFPGARLWVVAASIFSIDALCLSLSERLSADPFLLMQCLVAFAAGILAAMPGNPLHRHARAFAIAMIALFALAAMPSLLIFNHLVMSVRMPFTDDLMIAADRAVGFHWQDYAAFVAVHPWFTTTLHAVYDGIHVAIASCFFFHLICARNHRVIELASLLLVTGIVGSLIGIFFPALAAMTMLGTAELTSQLPPLAGRIFVEPLLAIRSADSLMLTHSNLTGVTALPSYHVTLGVLCVYACRGFWLLLVPMIAYVALMVASTPIFGGHYLADIAAALAFTAITIRAWNVYLAAWLAPIRFQASRPAIL